MLGNCFPHYKLQHLQHLLSFSITGHYLGQWRTVSVGLTALLKIISGITLKISSTWRTEENSIAVTRKKPADLQIVNCLFFFFFLNEGKPDRQNKSPMTDLGKRKQHTWYNTWIILKFNKLGNHFSTCTTCHSSSGDPLWLNRYYNLWSNISGHLFIEKCVGASKRQHESWEVGRWAHK